MDVATYCLFGGQRHIDPVPGLEPGLEPPDLAASQITRGSPCTLVSSRRAQAPIAGSDSPW